MVVKRLVSVVEVDPSGPATRRELSAAVRLDLELADGRRVVLLDDRGWRSAFFTDGGRALWAIGEIVAMARTVVGPDEPAEDESAEDMADEHWASLAQRARASGVDVSADELRRAPHDVVIGEALRSTVTRRRGQA